MFFVFLYCVCSFKDFSLTEIVNGNWSIKGQHEFYIAYFVRIIRKQQNEKLFQALLNDHFFNIFIKSNEEIRVEFMKYNFTVHIKNSENDRYATCLAKIDDSLYVDIFFFQFLP